jgi:hypothetical protein
MGVVRMRASVGSVARTRSVYWLDAERRLVPAFLPLPASRWWLCSPAIHRQQNRRHTASLSIALHFALRLQEVHFRPSALYNVPTLVS